MKTKFAIIILLSLVVMSCTSKEKKIQEQREKDPRYQYNVGIFYLNNGQADEAIIYLNKALELKPQYDLALDGLGLAYTMKGDLNQAAGYLQECIQVNPNLTDAHNHLGTVYQEMGLLDKAEMQFRRASADETYHSRELPYYNLARLFYIQEKNEQAMEYVNRAIGLNRRHALSFNLQGLLYERQKNFMMAIGSYKAALRLIPDDISLQYNLAGAYFKNQQYDEAKELFEVIKSRATDPEMTANIQKYLDMIEKKAP